MAEEFETNLLRAILAAQWFSISLSASRELYGKGYLSLSPAEKAALDQMVAGAIGANYQAITQQWLTAQKPAQGVGFQVQGTQSEKKS